MSHGSHSNYLNVHSSHANTGHGNSGGHSSHASHASTGSAHSNHANHTSTGAHSNHANHASTADPNTGAPITLTWTNWAANPASGEVISTSAAKIKELRDKLVYLQVNKGQYTKLNASNIFVPDNPAINVANVADASFSSGVAIDDVQYDNLQASLDVLNTKIIGAASGAPLKNLGDQLQEEDIITLKTKITALAAVDKSASHASHHNTGTHSSHSNHSNTGAHSNHSNHASTATHGSYGNHTSYANHASYANTHSNHSNHASGCKSDM